MKIADTEYFNFKLWHWRVGEDLQAENTTSLSVNHYRCSKFIFQILLFVAFVVLSVTGCSRDRGPDVSGVEVDFRLIPFYEDLFAISPDSVGEHLERLKNIYGRYLATYSEGVIGIGDPDDPQYVERLSRFLAYEPNAEVFDSCRRVFSGKQALKAELAQAFRYYQYYFPKKEVPDVYLHISGFNQSIVVDSGWVSVSVEKYLGSDCPFYEWLEIPVYLRGRMTPQRVVPDVVQAIGMTEFHYNDSIDDLISQMVYQGQVLQFVKHLIPDIPDSLLFGYTQKEYNWCMQHEEQMWKTLVEKKHLFATDPMIVRKYVDEAPFTNFFGQDSPGRTGRFIGYKLLESWLRRHPDKSIVELMSLSNPHAVLAEAGYRP